MGCRRIFERAYDDSEISSVVALSADRGFVLDGLGHDHVGQFVEQSFGFFPAETGIGDGDAVGQRFALLPGLFAGIEVAFEHQSHDGLAAFAELA